VWRPRPPLPLLWINTAVLVAGSIAWERARIAAEAGAPGRANAPLVAAGVLGSLFLVGQAAAWWQLQASAAAAPRAAAFFYLITALHGLHIGGGLVAWGCALRRLAQGDAAALATSVRLCAAYWHFLLLLWAAMFALLLSG